MEQLTHPTRGVEHPLVPTVHIDEDAFDGPVEPPSPMTDRHL